MVEHLKTFNKSNPTYKSSTRLSVRRIFACDTLRCCVTAFMFDLLDPVSHKIVKGLKMNLLERVSCNNVDTHISMMHIGYVIFPEWYYISDSFISPF
jgi:hypothetical protein